MTHGSSVNFSGKLYNPVFYGVDKETGYLNYDEIERIAKNVVPNMIIAGASAYSRDIDFKRFRDIADSVNALLLADISHPSGLIAKGILNDPIPHCHIVTTTTHKTLRGPRGGLILMGEDFDNPFDIRIKKWFTLKKMSSLLILRFFQEIRAVHLSMLLLPKLLLLVKHFQRIFFIIFSSQKKCSGHGR